MVLSVKTIMLNWEDFVSCFLDYLTTLYQLQMILALAYNVE
jgi:hypothetical protein